MVVGLGDSGFTAVSGISSCGNGNEVDKKPLQVKPNVFLAHLNTDGLDLQFPPVMQSALQMQNAMWLTQLQQKGQSGQSGA